MPTKLAEVWVVKGIVTDPSDYKTSPQLVNREPPRRGDPEYRFYAADPTDSSGLELLATFLSLERGLSHFNGAIVHVVEDPPEDKTLYDRWEDFVNASVHKMNGYPDTLQTIHECAYEQGILGSLLDALEQRR